MAKKEEKEVKKPVRKKTNRAQKEKVVLSLIYFPW